MKLYEEDVRRVWSALPSQVRDAISHEGAILAGGFVRDTIAGVAPSDIDLFVRRIEDVGTIRRRVAKLPGALACARTNNAITIKWADGPPVQIVSRWTYPEPEMIIADFDFTISMAAIWADKYSSIDSVCHPRFYADLAAKRLVYTRPDRIEDEGGSLLRAFSFSRRGYYIAPEDIAAVTARAMTAPQTRGLLASSEPDDRAAAEKLIAPALLSALRTVDPVR